MFVSRAHHQEVVSLMRQQIADLQCEREELLTKYHALKVVGAAQPEKLPDPPKSPYQQLGVKTRAALTDMGIGLHPTNRRAMEAVALSLHSEGWLDEQIAAKVRAGENVRPNGNGRR